MRKVGFEEFRVHYIGPPPRDGRLHEMVVSFRKPTSETTPEPAPDS
jgi:hypothetical protein